MSQRLRNRFGGTSGRVTRVIDCPGSRVMKGLESGTGRWGPWQWRLRAALPARSIAYATIVYFLGSCCVFVQLLSGCLLFGQTGGFWLPEARAGAGGRSEPRAIMAGPFKTGAAEVTSGFWWQASYAS